MQSPYDLVLFDLDGTISDPSLGILRSLNHALGYFGFPPILQSNVGAFIGPPLDQTFRALTGEADDHSIEAMVVKFRERYADIGYSENELYPGMVDALELLFESGLPLGICTSKRVDFAERILSMFGIRGYFRFVNGGEVGIHKWEQVALLRSQGLVSDASIMVGDRAPDIIAGHRNGLHAAGVLWGHGSLDELQSEQPSHLFATPAELMEAMSGTIKEGQRP